MAGGPGHSHDDFLQKEVQESNTEESRKSETLRILEETAKICEQVGDDEKAAQIRKDCEDVRQVTINALRGVYNETHGKLAEIKTELSEADKENLSDGEISEYELSQIRKEAQEVRNLVKPKSTDESNEKIDTSETSMEGKVENVGNQLLKNIEKIYGKIPEVMKFFKDVIVFLGNRDLGDKIEIFNPEDIFLGINAIISKHNENNNTNFPLLEGENAENLSKTLTIFHSLGAKAEEAEHAEGRSKVGLEDAVKEKENEVTNSMDAVLNNIKNYKQDINISENERNREKVYENPEQYIGLISSAKEILYMIDNPTNSEGENIFADIYISQLNPELFYTSKDAIAILSKFPGRIDDIPAGLSCEDIIHSAGNTKLFDPFVKNVVLQGGYHALRRHMNVKSNKGGQTGISIFNEAMGRIYKADKEDPIISTYTIEIDMLHAYEISDKEITNNKIDSIIEELLSWDKDDELMKMKLESQLVGYLSDYSSYEQIDTEFTGKLTALIEKNIISPYSFPDRALHKAHISALFLSTPDGLERNIYKFPLSCRKNPQFLEQVFQVIESQGSSLPVNYILGAVHLETWEDLKNTFTLFNKYNISKYASYSPQIFIRVKNIIGNFNTDGEEMIDIKENKKSSEIYKAILGKLGKWVQTEQEIKEIKDLAQEGINENQDFGKELHGYINTSFEGATEEQKEKLSQEILDSSTITQSAMEIILLVYKDNDKKGEEFLGNLKSEVLRINKEKREVGKGAYKKEKKNSLENKSLAKICETKDDGSLKVSDEKLEKDYQNFAQKYSKRNPDAKKKELVQAYIQERGFGENPKLVEELKSTLESLQNDTVMNLTSKEELYTAAKNGTLDKLLQEKSKQYYRGNISYHSPKSPSDRNSATDTSNTSSAEKTGEIQTKQTLINEGIHIEDITKEELQTISDSKEALTNFINFHQKLSDLNLQRIWPMRETIFTQIGNKYDTGGFDTTDNNYLSPSEVSIFLYTIMYSVKGIFEDGKYESEITAIKGNKQDLKKIEPLMARLQNIGGFTEKKDESLLNGGGIGKVFLDTYTERDKGSGLSANFKTGEFQDAISGM